MASYEGEEQLHTQEEEEVSQQGNAENLDGADENEKIETEAQNKDHETGSLSEEELPSKVQKGKSSSSLDPIKDKNDTSAISPESPISDDGKTNDDINFKENNNQAGSELAATSSKASVVSGNQSIASRSPSAGIINPSGNFEKAQRTSDVIDGEETDLADLQKTHEKLSEAYPSSDESGSLVTHNAPHNHMHDSENSNSDVHSRLPPKTHKDDPATPDGVTSSHIKSSFQQDSQNIIRDKIRERDSQVEALERALQDRRKSSEQSQVSSVNHTAKESQQSIVLDLPPKREQGRSSPPASNTKKCGHKNQKSKDSQKKSSMPDSEDDPKSKGVHHLIHDGLPSEVPSRTEEEEIAELFDIYHNGLLLVFKRYGAALHPKGTFEEIYTEANNLDFVKFYRMCRDFGIAHKKGLSQMALKHIFLQESKRGQDYKKIEFEQFRQVLVLCADELLSREPFIERYRTLPTRVRALLHRMDLADERRNILTKRMLAFGGFRKGDGKLGGHNEAGIPTRFSKEFSSFDYEKATKNVDQEGKVLTLLDTLRKPGEPDTPPPIKLVPKSSGPILDSSPVVSSKMTVSPSRATLRTHKTNESNSPRLPYADRFNARERFKQSQHPSQGLHFGRPGHGDMGPFQRDQQVLSCTNPYRLTSREQEALASALGLSFNSPDIHNFAPSEGEEEFYAYTPPQHQHQHQQQQQQQQTKTASYHAGCPPSSSIDDSNGNAYTDQYMRFSQTPDVLWNDLDEVEVPHGQLRSPLETSLLRPVLPLEPLQPQTETPRRPNAQQRYQQQPSYGRRGAVNIISSRKPTNKLTGKAGPRQQHAPAPGRKLVPARGARGPQIRMHGQHVSSPQRPMRQLQSMQKSSPKWGSTSPHYRSSQVPTLKRDTSRPAQYPASKSLASNHRSGGHQRSQARIQAQSNEFFARW